MLWNGRDGHGVEPHAYAHSHADAYTNTHANTNCNANTDAWAGYAWKHFDATTSRDR